MSRLSSSWAWVLLLGLGTSALAGCGESAAPVGATGRPGRDGGGDGDGDGGGDGDGDGDGDDAGTDGGSEPTDLNTPVIEVLDPAAASDPNDDDVLVDRDVTVRCRATKGPAPTAKDVLQSSFAIGRVATADDDSEMIVPGVVEPVSAEEFEATFTLSELPNGPVTFVCSATDTTEELTGTARVTVFNDRGPKITILEPADEAILALGSVDVRFRVEEDPVAAGDLESGIESVSLTALGRPFEVEELEDGEYLAQIDFTDTSVFLMAPSTADIVIAASNGRTPDAAVREARIGISLDSAPPEVEIVAPEEGDLLRGRLAIVLMITDPSGIDLDQLRARITSREVEPFVLEGTDWMVDDNEYTTSFDTRSAMFEDLVQLDINIDVADGNGIMTTVSTFVRLDNVAPLVSLDPPLIREYEFDAMDRMMCSNAFDPVGDLATNDLDTKPSSSLYRVLTMDRTNRDEGQLVGYHSGVDEESVRVFAQRKTNIPLLIDTNDDGACDEVNSNVDPPGDRPKQTMLTPLAPAGTAPYRVTMDADFDAPEHVPHASCTNVATNTNNEPRCLSSEMDRVIPGWLTSRPPAIYALAPDTTACTGNTWNNLIATVGGEGWVCIAARAVDNIGNVGVSPPLRVCLDDGVGTPLCNPATDTPPTCMDDCTAPPNFPANYMLFEQ